MANPIFDVIRDSSASFADFVSSIGWKTWLCFIAPVVILVGVGAIIWVISWRRQKRKETRIFKNAKGTKAKWDQALAARRQQDAGQSSSGDS